jgi:hypothetical protein
MIIFKGYNRGIVYLNDISVSDIKAVFFPKDFYGKYRYLGAVEFNIEGINVVEPLVLYMDSKRPWYAPRWLLRFLYLFGLDNSIVRVRNQWMMRLFYRLLPRRIADCKLKYGDLRVYVYGDEDDNNMAENISFNYNLNKKI